MTDEAALDQRQEDDIREIFGKREMVKVKKVGSRKEIRMTKYTAFV